MRPPQSPDERSGLSRTSDGRVVPSATQRALRRIRAEDPFVGWVGAISVGLLALFLRLWKLGTPHEFLFDETYYAKDAWSLLHFGYAREYADGTKANAAILAGNPDGLWKDNASMQPSQVPGYPDSILSTRLQFSQGHVAMWEDGSWSLAG